MLFLSVSYWFFQRNFQRKLLETVGQRSLVVESNEFTLPDVGELLERSKNWKSGKRKTVAEVTHDQEFLWPSHENVSTAVLNNKTTALEPTPDASTRPQPDRANYPNWVKAPPADVDGKLALVLVTDPFDNRFLCDGDMSRRVHFVVNAYAKQIADDLGLPAPHDLKFNNHKLASVVHDRFYALRSTSMGAMTQLYQLTVFDEAFREDLVRRVEQSVIQRRVSIAGLLSGGLLVGLAGLCGLFRIVTHNSPDPLAG